MIMVILVMILIHYGGINNDSFDGNNKNINESNLFLGLPVLNYFVFL